ncbi:MAG TPA: hypothetical protein DCZ55_04075 [Cyanobacteria bacterium UBA11371]|nr:hypothetical protein [Cyanobacteria bacterium UBA11371]
MDFVTILIKGFLQKNKPGFVNWLLANRLLSLSREAFPLPNRIHTEAKQTIMSLLQYSSTFCGNQKSLPSQTQLSSANILRYYVHIFTVSVIVCNKTTQIGKRINQNQLAVGAPHE